MKLLLVDDNIDIVHMLSKYFTIKGHQCKIASDGRMALEDIKNNQYDAVLLDLAMPEFSGHDIIDSLQKENKIAQKNIIAFTASSISDSDKKLLLDKGVKLILRKPLDPDEILAAIQSLR